jgi:hypothetical protein
MLGKLHARYLWYQTALSAILIMLIKRLTRGKFDFEPIQLRLLRSNHPRRLNSALFLTKNALFGSGKFFRSPAVIWSPESDLYIRIPDFQPSASHVLLVGDSQVEFYSRHFSNALSPLSCYGVHVGAKTITASYLFQSGQAIAQRSLDLTRRLPIGNYRNVVLTLGTLDVRTFFYAALKTGIVKNEEDLFAKFSNAVAYLAKEFERVYKNAGCEINLGIFEVMFSSGLAFSTPEKKESLAAFKREDFPILGTPEDRIRWTEQVNKILEEYCQHQGLHFFKLNEFFTTHSRQSRLLQAEDSFDGIHLSNPTALNLLYDSLKNKINVK